jgi:hypothetical protein
MSFKLASIQDVLSGVATYRIAPQCTTPEVNPTSQKL